VTVLAQPHLALVAFYLLANGRARIQELGPGARSRRADGRRAQEASAMTAKILGPYSAKATSPTHRWEAAAPV